MSTAPPINPTSPAALLADVHVSVRDDLEISRHRFRGVPAYIVRDPITFQSQRLDAGDYEIFVSIDHDRSLGEIFAELVRRGSVRPDDAERFYQFTMDLHRLGFLHLPVADDKSLYKRHVARLRAKRLEKITGILFLRIPLWNPNAFLDRTMNFVRPFFSRAAFLLWCCLMLAAGFVAWRHGLYQAQPISDLIVGQNLIALWVTLIILKVFHEFGHAYACKHFGGHVPEMGAYLILFTPCAYVDATASWGFSRKRDRIIVCLAGMYIESIIAALAVFVWAGTEPSLINALACNVVFLAGVVTVIFNINPLMRYDGYYILSDLLEIPNLRARSAAYVLGCLKRYVLNVPAPAPGNWRLRAILFTYGIAAAVYRVALLLTIGAILASKVFVVGVTMAVLYLGGMLVGTARRLIEYLWHAEETVPVRRRAVAVGVLTLLVIPLAAFFVPIPARVHARGLVEPGTETVIRAARAGFITQVAVRSGDVVSADAFLVEMRDDTAEESLATVRAELRAAEIRRDAYRVQEPDRAQGEAARIATHTRALREAQANLDALTHRAEGAAIVTEALQPRDHGRFVEQGTPLVTLASGGWRIRGVLTESQIGSAVPRPGDAVRFRPRSDPAQALTGTIVSVAPGGSRYLLPDALTQAGGGDIPVTLTDGQAAEPFFEIIVELPTGDAESLRSGITGTIVLTGASEPLGLRLTRRMAAFLARLSQA